MNPEKFDTLIRRLANSQIELSGLLASLDDVQDWQPGPGEWSFACLAAHLAAAERECFRDRIERIASGGDPYFAYYSNTDTDFGNPDLHDCLKDWRATRSSIFECLRELPETAWSLTGKHATQGVITIRDVLDSMIAHDQDHLETLELARSRFLGENPFKRA